MSIDDIDCKRFIGSMPRSKKSDFFTYLSHYFDCPTCRVAYLDSQFEKIINYMKLSDDAFLKGDMKSAGELRLSALDLMPGHLPAPWSDENILYH